MASAVALLQPVLITGLPLDTINAVANTVTAGAVLWAARILRKSITDIRLLHLQPPLSGLLLRQGALPKGASPDNDPEGP